jgi:hypothetical protein
MDVFPSDDPERTSYAFHIFSMPTVCPVPLIFDLIVKIIFGEEYKL